jgi:predicted DNA-binding transcriptional regulator AlpA
MTLEKDFYRVKEVCAILKISRIALWKRIKAGTVPQLETVNERVKGYSKETLRDVYIGLTKLTTS